MNDLKSMILAGRLSAAMSFAQKVWAVTARIPRGKVVTYKQVAAALNSHAYRAVGIALERNPYAPQIPCHRVIGSDGRLVGYAGGLPLKARLLKDEGIAIKSGRVDLDVFGYQI